MAQKRNDEVIIKQLQSQFPKIGGNEARKIVQIVSRQISIKRGPYPSPEDYDYYHEINPDLTSQMKKMVLKEQEHQHELDKIYLQKDFSLKRTGQVLAFILLCFSLSRRILDGFTRI